MLRRTFATLSKLGDVLRRAWWWWQPGTSNLWRSSWKNTRPWWDRISRAGLSVYSAFSKICDINIWFKKWSRTPNKQDVDTFSSFPLFSTPKQVMIFARNLQHNSAFTTLQQVQPRQKIPRKKIFLFFFPELCPRSPTLAPAVAFQCAPKTAPRAICTGKSAKKSSRPRDAEWRWKMGRNSPGNTRPSPPSGGCCSEVQLT